MPEPLGIDTSLSGGVGTGVDGIDSPEFSAGLPVADFSNWQEVFGSKPRDGAFTGAFNDNSPLNAAKGDLRAQIVAYGKQFLGMPYTWGGSSPSTSFDCSGLVQYVTKHFGLNLPRVSFAQANSGRRVPISKLRPGDLVAWDNSSRNNGADHIAIYIGGGKILEAARRGTNIRINNIYDLDNAWGVALTYPGETGSTSHSKGGDRPI